MTRRLLPLLLPLLLAAAEPIQGQVTDPAGWTGLVAILADHEVDDPAAPRGSLTQATLDAEGRFRLDPPAEIEQFALRICDGQGRILYGRSHLKAGEDLGAIVLGAAGVLSGALSDDQGRPLPTVTLRLDRKHDNDCDHQTRGQSVTVAADGTFRVDDLAAGTWLACVVDEAWSPKPIEVVVTTGTATTVDLRASPAARIVGHLRDAEGDPIADVALRIGGRTATSDADGAFTFGGLDQGTHRITVTATDLSLPQGAGRIEVQAGATTTVDLTLVPAGALDLGLVCAEAGRALPAEIQVSLNPETGPRDRRHVPIDGGAVRVDGLAPGPYEIEVKAPGTGRAKAKVTIASGQRERIDLTLPLAFTVTGTVRATDGGIPADLSITAEADRGENGFSWFGDIDATIAADGTFTIPDVEAGTLRFDLRAPGFQPLRRALVIGATAPPEQDCVLRPGGRRTLVIRDAEGAAVAEAEASVDLDEDLAITATSDDQGRAILDGLPPGRVGFRVEHPDFLARLGELDQGTAEVQVILDPGLAIVGQVVDADGKPVADASLFAWGPAHSEDSDSRHADTDADGRFRLNGLAAGTYQVSASAGEATLQRDIVAGTTDLVLRLPRTVTASLTILRHDGSPAAGVTVRASTGSDHDSEETDSQGRTTLTLPEGWWEISADLDDHPAIQTDLRVVSGMEPVTLRGEAGLALRGTVGPGRPEGLRIWLSSPDGLNPGGNHEGLAVAEDGTFAGEGIPPGRWVLTAGIGEQRQAVLHQQRILLDGRTPPVAIVLPPLGGLSTTAPGDADDYLIALALHDQVYVWARCAAEETVLPVVPVGVHHVSMGNRQGLIATGLAEVTEGATATVTWDLPRIRLDFAATLAFTDEVPREASVIFAPIHPLTRTSTQLMRRSLRRGELDGERLLAEGLTAGRWWVQIDANAEGEDDVPGRWISQVVVGEGLPEPRLLAGGAEIRGRVLDSDGQPLSRAQVTFLPQTGDPGQDFLQARVTVSDGQGGFRFAGFAPGSYTVSAQVGGRGVAVRERVAPGSEAIDLILGQARRLVLRTSLPPGVMPQAVAIRGGSMVVARWRDGALRFEGQRCLSDGRWTIHTWADGHAVHTSILDLAEDIETSIDLVPAGRIDVRLTVPDGAPAAGRQVILIDEEGELSPRPRWVTAEHLLGSSLILPTEADGRIRIDGVAPGHWFLECDGGTADVEVRPGETTVVNVRCTH